MIVSFASKKTEELFYDRLPAGFPAEILQRARRKLMILNAARDIGDLRAPPGNRLEALKGDRKGQYSIRINEQWRLCFRFERGMAMDVEIADYHR